MRLINATTLELKEFVGDIPTYAILSHTWEEEEVSYQDLTLRRSSAEKMKGFSKIDQSCRRARESGIDYVWVDTCCIDKTSSAELTEAINSMFQWYASSAECYAFLSDLPATNGGNCSDLDVSNLSKCRWFTRGWTLQELLAPQVVLFYDSNWQPRGTKVELSQPISLVTGINTEVLLDSTLLSTFTVARRMSWAACRKTTRVEDIAYSLLGVFGVNMPMIYGEGENAFIRLQEEIARQINDLTLFAWQTDTSKLVTAKENSSLNAGPSPVVQRYRGILAERPAEFASMGLIDASHDARFNNEFSITNKGFKMETRLVKGTGNDGYILKLQCHRRGKPEEHIGIFLKRHGAGLYARDQPHKLATLTNEMEDRAEPIYISKIVTPVLSNLIACDHRHAFHFRDGFVDNPYFRWVRMTPSSIWDSQRKLFLTDGLSSFVGYGYFTSVNPVQYPIPGGAFMVICGLADSGPWLTFCLPSKQAGMSEAVSKNDLQSLAELARKDQSETLKFEEHDITAVPFRVIKSHKCTISLVESVLDNQPIYCVDMKVEEVN